VDHVRECEWHGMQGIRQAVLLPTWGGGQVAGIRPATARGMVGTLTDWLLDLTRVGAVLASPRSQG
jgi:hypothetical protein